MYENYDPCFPDQPVVDLYLPIWANLPAFRSKPAFIWADGSGARQSLSYAHLNASANAMASQLLIPLQRGDTLLLLCSPGLQLVQLLFACQRAGLRTVPIIPPNPSFSSTQDQHNLIRVLQQTKPRAAVAHPLYVSSIQSYTRASHANTTLSDLLKQIRWVSLDPIPTTGRDVDESWKLGPDNWYSGCKPDEVYLIQYTSGATGIPKPVLVTAGSAVHNVRSARKAYDLQPSSVIVSWLPQYHDCGLMFLLLTIVAGATCVLTSPSEFIKRPRLWLELVSEFKATCTPVPSFALPLLVKRGEGGTSPLKLQSLINLVLINEPIYRASVDEFVDKYVTEGLDPSSIAASYGLAENCTFVSTAWRSGEESNYPNIPTYNKLLPSARLGRCGDDGDEEMEIVVVDEEICEPVQDGVEGEIWVGSASNASGYLSYPSLTREVFQARLRGTVSRNFVRTGDRGIVTGGERYLYVTGRACDVIRVRERLVHPHYLETAAFNSCPALLRGGCLAAFGVEEGTRHAIVLVGELHRGGVGDAAMKICERMRAGVLEEEKVEVGLVVLVKSGNLPKTTSGKIRRWAAKEKLVNGELEVVSKMCFLDSEEAKSIVTRSRGGGEEMEFLLSFRRGAALLSLL